MSSSAHGSGRITSEQALEDKIAAIMADTYMPPSTAIPASPRSPARTKSLPSDTSLSLSQQSSPSQLSSRLSNSSIHTMRARLSTTEKLDVGLSAEEIEHLNRSKHLPLIMSPLALQSPLPVSSLSDRERDPESYLRRQLESMRSSAQREREPLHDVGVSVIERDSDRDAQSEDHELALSQTMNDTVASDSETVSLTLAEDVERDEPHTQDTTESSPPQGAVSPTVKSSEETQNDFEDFLRSPSQIQAPPLNPLTQTPQLRAIEKPAISVVDLETALSLSPSVDTPTQPALSLTHTGLLPLTPSERAQRAVAQLAHTPPSTFSDTLSKIRCMASLYEDKQRAILSQSDSVSRSQSNELQDTVEERKGESEREEERDQELYTDRPHADALSPREDERENENEIDAPLDSLYPSQGDMDSSRLVYSDAHDELLAAMRRTHQRRDENENELLYEEEEERESERERERNRDREMDSERERDREEQRNERDDESLLYDEEEDGERDRERERDEALLAQRERETDFDSRGERERDRERDELLMRMLSEDDKNISNSGKYARNGGFEDMPLTAISSNYAQNGGFEDQDDYKPPLSSNYARNGGFDERHVLTPQRVRESERERERRAHTPTTQLVRVDQDAHTLGGTTTGSRYSTPSRVNGNVPLTTRSHNASPISVFSASVAAAAAGPQSALSALSDKPVRVVVRVRPFSQRECELHAKRTISLYRPTPLPLGGGDGFGDPSLVEGGVGGGEGDGEEEVLVVVNPKAFDADPDEVAVAAMAVKDSQWATPFRFDTLLWTPRHHSQHPALNTISQPLSLQTPNPKYSQPLPSHNALTQDDLNNPESEYPDQWAVFEAVGRDCVDCALNGVSVACFAVGAPGSGKTHTLFGKPTVGNTSNGYSTVTSQSSRGRERDRERAKSPHNRFSQQPRSLSRERQGVVSLPLSEREREREREREIGIAPRVFCEILRAVRGSRVKTPLRRVFLSVCEIRNDRVTDALLSYNTDNASFHSAVTQATSFTSATGTPHNALLQEGLKVREHPLYGPYAENQCKIEVFDDLEIMRIFTHIAGNGRHTTHSHNKAHVVATLELAAVDLSLALRADKIVWARQERHTTPQRERAGTPQSLRSTQRGHTTMDLDSTASAFSLSPSQRALTTPMVRVHFVDLAACESASRENERDRENGSERERERERNENKSIRRSLNTLSQVIQALCVVPYNALTQSPHTARSHNAPFRDSSLTFLLRDALCGLSRTTVVATVSPAEVCYEDTLATLRYAEALLCERAVRRVTAGVTAALTQQRRPSLGDATSSVVPLLTLPSQSLSLSERDRETEGERESALSQQTQPQPHNALSQPVRGSLAARQLLQHTVSDPQQRIAKLSRRATTPLRGTAATNNNTTPANNALSQHHTNSALNTSMMDKTSFYGNNTQIGGYYNQPSSTTADRPRGRESLTGMDNLEQLQSAHRSLQGEVVELQIDVDALRTDRDALTVELRGTREHLHEVEQEKLSLTVKCQGVSKSLSVAERELSELRALVRRREEAVERVLSELNDEKQARLSAEQAYHTRTNDFLTRFDNLKKENKMLLNSLEVSRSRDGFSGLEKQQFLEQISLLQSSLTDQSRSLNTLQQQHTQALESLSLATEKAHKLDELLPRYEELQSEKMSIFSKLDKLRGEYEVLLTERNSLASLVEQKDSLLWLHNTQAQANVKLLTNQLNSLQLTQQSMVSSEDWQRMTQALRLLFTQEDAALSEELTDAQSLIVQVRNVCEKKTAESEKLRRKFERESAARKEMERKLVESVALLREEESARVESERRVEELEQQVRRLRESAVSVAAQNAGIQPSTSSPNTLSQPPFNTLTQPPPLNTTLTQHPPFNTLSQPPHPAPNSQPPLDPLSNPDPLPDTTLTQLIQQLEQSRSDNAYLLGQLEATQRENTTLRESLSITQSTAQREFSSLWLSVQELNKLDALKDKSIQDLLAERSQLTAERDALFERVRVLEKNVPWIPPNGSGPIGMGQGMFLNTSMSLPTERSSAMSPTNVPRVPLTTLSTSSVELSRYNSPAPPLTQRERGSVSVASPLNLHDLASRFNPEIEDVDELLSEKLLERQIEELSDFLQDEERLKKARSLRSVSTGSATSTRRSVTSSYHGSVSNRFK